MTSPTSPASSLTSENPGGRPIACLRCRTRRSFCSKDRPTCSRCRNGGLKCVYEESRKVPVTEAYLRELEAKAKAYDDSVGQRPPSVPEKAAKTRDASEEKAEEFEDEHALLGPFTELTIDQPSTSYKGPGSSDNFLRRFRRLSGIKGDDRTLDINPIFYDPEALPSRRAGISSRVRLPPRDVALRLFAAQYTYMGTIFAFSQPERFMEELTIAYCGPPDPTDRNACLTYAKVLLLLAFGQMYSVNQWIDFRGPPGFEYFSQALKLLPDPHEEGSVLCVETLSLTGYFLQNLNRRDAAFLYVGMALRMAISLGLHQEVPSSVMHGPGAPILDEAAREHRRRVWWSIYGLDRIISIKSGNPLTIQDDDIGVALPSRLPTENAYCPGAVVRHYTELSRILSDITRALYRKSTESPKSAKTLMVSVQNIVLALSKWNQELPDELRFDPSKLSTTRESVSTYAHYHQCINMVARPLFYHVVKKRIKNIYTHAEAKEQDWKEGLSQTTVRVVEMCVKAARDTIKMFSFAAQKDLVATYGYMDTEHIFSADIVLVMVCIAFPTNQGNIAAMRTGLELLRNLAQRGNSHMAARYELLEHLGELMPGNLRTETTLMSSTLDPFGYRAEMPLYGVPEGSAAHSAVDANSAPGWISEGAHHPEIGTALSDFTTDDVFFPIDMPAFSADGVALEMPLFDETANGDTDFMLWEEGFANPAVDVGYDITQWTQGAQFAERGSNRDIQE